MLRGCLLCVICNSNNIHSFVCAHFTNMFFFSFLGSWTKTSFCSKCLDSVWVVYSVTPTVFIPLYSNFAEWLFVILTMCTSYFSACLITTSFLGWWMYTFSILGVVYLCNSITTERTLGLYGLMLLWQQGALSGEWGRGCARSLIFSDPFFKPLYLITVLTQM